MTAATASSRVLQCMEIVGGNDLRQEQFTGTGTEIWVDSRPLGGEAGGDIHYLSMCGGGHVTRLVLADVAGHGGGVAGAARRLRALMRKNMNTLNQARFARALNEEFSAADDGRFATALLMTYFAPTRHLLVCNAGHPPPLWYRRDRDEWVPLVMATSDEDSVRRSKGRYHLERVANLPLGVLAPTDYVQFAIEPGLGDLVVVYTDAWIEARSPDGKLLGEAGLLDLARRVGPRPAREFGTALAEALDDCRGGGTQEDDQTLVVLEHVGGDLPPMTLGRATRSLLKMLGILPV